ncbi:MAG: COX15/CtaA family protein [Sciscionella sp.]
MSSMSALSKLPVPPVRWQRALAVLMVIVQCGIAVSGSVVRVTGSGLGCPTWPQCAAGSLVPVAHPVLGQLHQWIEFTNRMLGIAVGVVSVLVFLAAVLHRPLRRRYVALAATMPLGVVLQAVVGGITVLTQLTWWTVCIHFLISPMLVWFSVLLLRAVSEPDGPTRPLIPLALRGLLLAQAALLVALLIAGTLVTAAGPHSGDLGTPRLQLPIPSLAQGHADLMFVFLGSIAAFGFALRITGASQRIWRRFWLLLGLVAAQGALGIVQYTLGVPDVLVIFHVLGAMLVIVALASLWCATRERTPVHTSAEDSHANPLAVPTH